MQARDFSWAVSAAVWVALTACNTSAERVEPWREPEKTKWEEAETALPTALPLASDLIEFEVRRRDRGSFFVDRAHLVVGPDGITRLALISQSVSGARSATYEGFRCATGENRLYAIAGDDGWSEPRTSVWRDVPNSSFDPRSVLMQDFLCDATTPRSPEQVVQRLRYPKPDWR
ncbi:MAG: hypothetical protein DWQ11_09575 [Proteobacteria bacterium]|nr:MAG: hypothetical protein DWQ11_09575 [Pseudomonadota bacterium]